MFEPTHAPGWRGRPASYADLQPADTDELGPLEIFAIFSGCLMAAVSLGAGIYTWIAA